MSNKKYNILIVDDEPYILEAFQVIVEGMENYNLFCASTFDKVKEIVNSNIINMAIVDIVLPEIDGYEICTFLGKQSNSENAYYILMSADKKELLDRLKAYKVGAQDFLQKPFDFKEVELIISSKYEYFLRTNNVSYDTKNIFTSGKFLVDKDKKMVKVGTQIIDLTSKEYSLFLYLITNSEKLIELDSIIEEVWGNQYNATHENVRSLVHRIRHKIEEDPKNPIYLVNNKKGGYIFYPSGE